jgi:hypothetical protein
LSNWRSLSFSGFKSFSKESGSGKGEKQNKIK